MDNDEHTGPFNIGNPGEFTMSELAEVVKSIIDPDAKIEFRENTADDPGRRKPDITKAKELLGWEPKVTLKQARLSISLHTCTRLLTRQFFKPFTTICHCFAHRVSGA